MIMNGDKYRTETSDESYHINMSLTILNFSHQDNVTYQCVAKNSLGETEGDIRLNGKNFIFCFSVNISILNFRGFPLRNGLKIWH